MNKNATCHNWCSDKKRGCSDNVYIRKKIVKGYQKSGFHVLDFDFTWSFMVIYKIRRDSLKTITLKRSAAIGYSILFTFGGAILGVVAFLGVAAWFCIGGGWQVL